MTAPSLQNGGPSERHIMVPFDPREAISIGNAAGIADVSPLTMRKWCERHGLGRKIGPNTKKWKVSRVALEMFVNNDEQALKAYLAGDRESLLVAGYFTNLNIPLPARGGE